MKPSAACETSVESACVVLAGGNHHLLPLRRTIEARREWSPRPLTVNELVRGYRLPDISGINLNSWAADPEQALGDVIRSFPIVTRQCGLVSIVGAQARLATQFEWIGGSYASQPVLYECNDNPDHLWTAGEVDTSLDCPSITHSAPRPKCKRV